MQRILCISMLLILLLPTAGQAKLSVEARETLRQAQQQMDQKQYGAAAEHLRAYMKTTRETPPPQVWLLLGGAFYESGEIRQAAGAYVDGFKIHPDNAALCLNAGVASYELERYDVAARFMETAYGLQENPKAELLYQAGSAFYLAGRYKESARVLLRLLQTSPSPRKEWVRITVHALLGSGQTARGEELLIRYLDMHPGEAEYWRMLAKLHLDLEEYSEAGSALEICYRLQAPSANELEQLASLYTYQRAPLMAAATLRRAYGSSPAPGQALKIAALLASGGRTQEAVNYLDRHVETTESNLERGKLLYRHRQFAQAEKVLTGLLESRDAPEARFYIALCAWEQRDWKRARLELTRIVDHKRFRARAKGCLAVLNDLEQARLEINGQ